MDSAAPLRVYTDGIFDLFHIGHANLFKQIKNDLFDHPVHLIVGVSGSEVRQLKGNTVSTDEERYAMVEQCKYVDEIIIECPWEINKEFLETWKIDRVVHDNIPYTCGSKDGNDVYKYVKETGIFVTSKRTPGISTSDIISRILKNYNVYILRNLKRGIEPRIMNIGKLKANYLLIKDEMKYKKKEAQDMFHKFSEKTNREFNSSIDELWDSCDKMLDAVENKRLNILRAIYSDDIKHSDNIEKNTAVKKIHPLGYIFNKKVWLVGGIATLIFYYVKQS